MSTTGRLRSDRFWIDHLAVKDRQWVESRQPPRYRGQMVEVSPFSREPYRRRTWLRQRLPFPLLDLAPKGADCEAAGGEHEWYNQDDHVSACYHCKVARKGKLWQRA